jgi:hypothetical protein
MRALVVYESYFGCTKTIAEVIADSLRLSLKARIVPIEDARHHHLGHYDLLVVGAPTHARGMSRPTTRESVAELAAQSHSSIRTSNIGIGVREWLDAIGLWAGHPAAAFDTRLPGPTAMTGRASKGIASELRRHGFLVVKDSLSCLVDRNNNLLIGEADRAADWAVDLTAAFNRAVRKARSIEGSPSYRFGDAAGNAR